MKSSWKVDLLCCSEYCFKIIVMIFSYIREIDSFTSTLPPCHIVPNITYPFTLSSFLKNAEKGDPGNVTYSQRNILVNFHENELFSLFTYNTQLRISSLMWYGNLFTHTHTQFIRWCSLVLRCSVSNLYYLFKFCQSLWQHCRRHFKSFEILCLERKPPCRSLIALQKSSSLHRFA